MDRYLKTGAREGPGGNYFESTRNVRYFRDGEEIDLAADRSELNDLAAQHPGRVAAMEKVFEEWRSR